MAGVTDTQSLRFGQVTDVIDFTMVKNLADDIAVQLDAADTARTKALKRPEVLIQRNALLAIPTGFTTITWDTKVVDTHSMVDLVGQPTRVTCGSTAGTGIYQVTFEAHVDTTGWTRADVLLLKNGTLYAQRTYWGAQPFVSIYEEIGVYLGATTDFITAQIYHEGGATTNLNDATLRVQKICDG